MIDPYWLEGTTPLWTVIALGYWFGALYLRVFDSYEHERHVWASFLTAGTGIFLLVNHGYIFTDGSLAGGTVEYIGMTAISAIGISMFLLARKYARLKTAIEQYRQMMKYYDTSDIEQ